MKGKVAQYVTIGTNDLPRAKEFYDSLFSDLGASSFAPNDRSFFWRIEGSDIVLVVLCLMMAMKLQQEMEAW